MVSTISNSLMAALTGLQEFWAYAEPLTWLLGLLAAGYFLLRNPLRRDRLFGYRPTVIAVVRCRSTNKVLLGHHKESGRWILPQGGISGDESVIEAGEKVLAKETGLNRMVSIGRAFYLGRVRMTKGGRLDRFMDPAEFSLARAWRGKSYVALLVKSDEEHAAQELNGEFLFSELKFVSRDEAAVLLAQGHEPAKAAIYRKILAGIKPGQTGKLEA